MFYEVPFNIPNFKRVKTMKAESIMAHVNMCYQKGEIPLEIKELHIYHPTYDPYGHDDFLLVNPDVRLDGCAMLLIEVRVYRRKEDRYYEYQNTM